MRFPVIRLLPLAVALAMPFSAFAQKQASVWLTTPDTAALLQKQSASLPFGSSSASGAVITVDPKQTFQTMDGFGFALTGGSAQLLTRMDSARRAALLRELFTTEGNGIGVSYLRLTIGASDMNEHVFSYDDLPEGQTDPAVARFSIDPDRKDVIPVMKEILAINPKIKVLASPWSAPLWMKTNGAAQGGVLKPEYYEAYATYLVKYVQAMQAEGIHIDTMTVQNEPLNEKNTPSMLMLGEEQDVFIRDHLGPAFKKAGIHTGIVLYDHNLDHPLYVTGILRDKEAAQYVDGSGWHLYGGTVDTMTAVHNQFPHKNIYFTEQSVTDLTSPAEMKLSKPFAHVMIGVSRNWSRNVMLWNLAADPANEPHTNNGGCGSCRGAITLDGDHVTRLVAFYLMGHVSKFVPPGSVRIGSTMSESLPNVAFQTPEGKTVLLVSNVTDMPQSFSIRDGGGTATTQLQPGAVASYVW